MKAMTIRGIDSEMSTKLKQLAASEKKSVNQLVLDLLKQNMGMQKKKRYTKIHSDLDDLFGQWSESEFEEIQEIIEEQRKIDVELWT
ncbi:MAG: antitoxin [Deltaproteobacteria bacterium]|nr:MAG: antitoxin [Deltaproteobacteria bacterium]